MKQLGLTRTVKDIIEKKTGLVLGDAVNVALFVLTIFSLVLAGAGVYVAVLTLHGAEKSGDQQTLILNGSRKALEGAEASLSKQNDLLATNLLIAEKQQDSLKQSLLLAHNQLMVMTAQNAREAELASRKADVVLAVKCGTMHGEGKSFAAEVSEAVELSKGDQEYFTASVDRTGLMVCEVSLENKGNAILNNAFIEVRIQRMEENARGNISQPIRYSGAFADSEALLDANEHRFVFLVKGQQVFPPTGRMDNSQGAMLELQIPDEISVPILG